MIPVAVCVLVKDNKVLAERRPENDAIDPGKICFPAGHIEANETPVEAVRREMQEELGISVKDVEFYKKLKYVTSGKKFEMYYFVCTDWRNEIKPSSFVGDLMWLEPESCNKFDFHKDVEISKKIINEYGK